MSNKFYIAINAVININKAPVLDWRDSNIAIKGSEKHSTRNTHNPDHTFIKSLEVKSMKANSTKSEGIKMFNNQNTKQDILKSQLNTESVILLL